MTISDSSGDLPDRGWFERIIRRIVWILGWISGRFWDAMRFLGRVFGRIWGALRSVGGKIKRRFTRIFSRKTSPPQQKRSRWRYFGPVSFNMIIRPSVSLAGGLTTSFLLWLPLEVMSWVDMIDQNPLNPGLLQLLAGAIAILIGLPDQETPEKVPEAHAAIFTFLGARWRFYRTEGEYNWTGKRVFLGRSKKVSEPGTDTNGFVYLGEIPIRIWNAADEKNKASIVCVARDSSAITTTLTIVLELVDPYDWVDTQDALGDVAERARSALRTSISFFVGTDVAGVKSVLGLLMAERTIVTAFLQKTVGTNIIHSLLEDKTGAHQYVIVGQERDGTPILGETVDQAKQRFLIEVAGKRAEFDDDMWQAAVDKNGAIIASDRSVSEALTEVANAVGADLLRASIGNIALSEKVTEEANQAASEVFQRSSQLASAETMRLVRKKLRPTKTDLDNPHYQDATMVAAAQDNPNVRVVHVTGSGDRFSKAAAVHASEKK